VRASRPITRVHGSSVCPGSSQTFRLIMVMYSAARRSRSAIGVPAGPITLSSSSGTVRVKKSAIWRVLSSKLRQIYYSTGSARSIDAGFRCKSRRSGRLDTFHNVLRNPNVGIIFPGVTHTLRVAGKAIIVRDGILRDSMKVNGKAPNHGLVVGVKRFSHTARGT
jgi:hypothetical protein